MFKEYRGFYMEFNFYGSNECSVQYCGDDLLFESEEDARAAIDEIIEFERGIEQ